MIALVCTRARLQCPHLYWLTAPKRNTVQPTEFLLCNLRNQACSAIILCCGWKRQLSSNLTSPTFKNLAGTYLLMFLFWVQSDRRLVYFCFLGHKSSLDVEYLTSLMITTAKSAHPYISSLPWKHGSHIWLSVQLLWSQSSNFIAA